MQHIPTTTHDSTPLERFSALWRYVRQSSDYRRAIGCELSSIVDDYDIWQRRVDWLKDELEQARQGTKIS